MFSFVVAVWLCVCVRVCVTCTVCISVEVYLVITRGANADCPCEVMEHIGLQTHALHMDSLLQVIIFSRRC